MSLNIYPGGLARLVQRFEKKQTPMAQPLDYLPPVDCDLAAVRSTALTPGMYRPDTLPKTTLERVYLEITAEFEGQSAFLYLHAMLIAILRRRPIAEGAERFYFRLWEEQGDWLAQHLTTRWRISAATTFGELGRTAHQRAVGTGLSVMFDMIKLYESERALNGRQPTQLGKRVPADTRPDLPLGLGPYMTRRGDLDRNLLGRLLQQANQDRLIYPLAKVMIGDIMGDSGTVFARMQRRKGIKPTKGSEV